MVVASAAKASSPRETSAPTFILLSMQLLAVQLERSPRGDSNEVGRAAGERLQQTEYNPREGRQNGTV